MKQYHITDHGKLNKHEGKLVIKPDSNWWFILSPKELATHQSLLKISKKTLQECQDEVDLPKLEVYDHYDFGLIHIIERIDGMTTKQRVNFYLGSNYLILVTSNYSPWLQNFEKEVLQLEDDYLSPEKILYLLLDKLTSQEGKFLDNLENEINALEACIIEGKKQDYIKEIIRLRKKLLHLKRHYEPLIDISSALVENDNDLFDPKATRYFRILTNRIERLNRRVYGLDDNVTQIREAYDAQVDISLNKIMKVFTVITVVFAPLTVIVGWYGMNFDIMPELRWRYGYLYVLGLSLLSIITCLIFFKRKKWL